MRCGPDGPIGGLRPLRRCTPADTTGVVRCPGGSVVKRAVWLLSAVAGLLASLLLAGAVPVAASSGPIRVVDNGLDERATWSLYEQHWASTAPPAGFDGSVADCRAGTVDPAYLADQTHRLNVYRRLAGVPPVGLDAAADVLARQQQVALLVAHGPQRPSHEPPSSQSCWSAIGAAGSATSNLYKVTGRRAIDGYIADTARPLVGHRRWLLSEGQRSIAIGEVVGTDGTDSGHAVEVVAGHRTSDASLAVAWPPAGYLPADLVPARWSLQTVRTIFTPASTVRVTVDDRSVAVREITIGSTDPEAFVSFVIDPPPPGAVVEVTVDGLAASAGVPFLRWRTGIIDAGHLDVDLGAPVARHTFEYLLGRPPTSAEGARLERDPGAALAALVGTDEQIGADVERLYSSMLGRRPDAGGRAFWVAEIASGRKSLRDVVVAFFVSPEFIARTEQGRGAVGWVDAIYQSIHQRDADAGGRAFWVEEIAGGRRSRERIVADFYDSPESVRRRVTALTELLLGRSPSEIELARWTAPDQRAVLVALLRSAEFAALSG